MGSEVRSEGRFRVGSGDVVHEVMDDQVVVVRLDTGVYYSLGGVAALVWTELVRGASVGELRVTLQARYPSAEIDAGLEEFICELATEGLIVAADRAPLGIRAEEAAGLPAPVPLPDRYAAPRLEKYTDMQELLLIDPVHETDERGWPHPDRGAS
jgi:hypothetical protein